MSPPPQPRRGRSDGIDALEFTTPQPRHDHSSHTSRDSSPFGLLRDDESLLSNVVDGIIENDRKQMKRELSRYLSYGSAFLSSLCAGSIMAFSLYGHMFVDRLHYNLYNVNAISITAELSMYLPVALFGYLVDRYSPRPISFLSGVFFAIGYFLAAITYRAGPPDEGGYPFGVMLVAFVFIGMGTSSMMISAVTACAKNFGQSKYKGIALSLPVAAFGLSSMWQSQVGSRLLYETMEDGSRGNVDVHRYFLFLGATLLSVGLIGAILQKVINEEELIDDAVEGLERSGLLDEPSYMQRSPILFDAASHGRRYGTIDEEDTLDVDEEDLSASMLKARDAERQKKMWLLNAETRRFLADHTMWLLAIGFFLATGPVETFINNLGSMIAALYPPGSPIPSSNNAATNVGVQAVTSTLARVIAGLLSDFISPSPPEKSSHAQYTALRPGSSHSLGTLLDSQARRRCSISRLTLLILASGLPLTLGYLLLISPLITDHPSSFLGVSALLGLANGAGFSLTPLLISAVWGVQNFGTNWGIVATMPALGATLWSALFSIGYQAHVDSSGHCFGPECFSGVSAGMAAAGVAAMVSWYWIGWGTNGWWSRGVIV